MLFTHNNSYLPLTGLLTDLTYLPYLKTFQFLNICSRT